MSMALGQLLSKLLFGVTPFDVPTLLAVPAVLGAATLAASLAASPHDIRQALARYESLHRVVIRPRQRGVWIASHLLIPRSGLGIALRNTALRIRGGR